jgi:polysaccharide deacetylase family protein (PEP-CTERM system associated)
MKPHVLTVALEDYYHVSAFNRIIESARWSRFERRLEIGTDRTLALLDEFKIRATFFVLGWVADNAPELVRKVASRGHEIASKGYYHRGIWEMSPSEFRDDLARAQESLERASGQSIVGYRVARRWFTERDLWALDTLADAGYLYDSSIKPILRAFASEPWRRFVHQHRSGDRSIWEFPPSSADVLGYRIPIAGGNYFRQLPAPLLRRAVAKWDRSFDAPFVMYFHTWELDPDQPRIRAAPIYQRVRHYRNLGRMETILREYFGRYRFESIAQRLGVDTESHQGNGRSVEPLKVFAPAAATHVGSAVTGAMPVSVVVPCYNEEAVLQYLANTLDQVADRLRDRYHLTFIFVNDGSSDGTAVALRRNFGRRPDCVIVDHGVNRGVSAAILSGIRRAETEVVCSIDCDCTYDPQELGAMIPLLTDGVDLVTASPYHRHGGVRNVPAWRLSLSKSASAFYRLVLRHKLATYTSCFRVYRRSAILGLPLYQPGFLGITELLGRLDLSGSRILEYPTVLEVRVLGRSKMKIVRTILGHLGLVGSLLLQRCFGTRPRGRVHALPDGPGSELLPPRAT